MPVVRGPYARRNDPMRKFRVIAVAIGILALDIAFKQQTASHEVPDWPLDDAA
jgi:hypothetical protein